ncbi:uncharacterized protein PV07_01874 [Cladophialophora immunda]|uniref:Uncharacterized protein n=1 Tax=Cladophialophora immunda TaxID=569365 RepID=A0A0D2DHC3_9EURO|nr:uncharacterized protein PV07_01874 [Cladophialophora immunda]KIW35159.1 hypothetical protein PV07_01874 [Cladophialophora immunda]
MALSSASQTDGINTGHWTPISTLSRPANVPSPEASMSTSKTIVSQEVQVKSVNGTKLHGQIYHQKPAETRALHSVIAFRPQVAIIQASNIEYPKNHLLGIPQEVRDTIIGLVHPTKQTVGAPPSTSCEIFHFVCRQTYHESTSRFSTQATVLVPSNRVEEFLKRSLNIRTLRSNAYQSVKSLFVEIPHNSNTNVFLQMGEVLRRSVQLEELQLFGVGADGYGVKTSSAAHPCGKHDISIMPLVRKLSIDGQQYIRRLALANSIPFLDKLRILVLDNLNFPLLQSHVFRNKPLLEKLHIAADPRTVMHAEYKAGWNHTVGGLIFLTHDEAPPVKELRVDSNSIFTASQIVLKVAGTLERLELVIPDMSFQVHTTNRINFFSEATTLLHRLHLDARRLRELKICVHGAISEDSYHYANFMGALKDCVSRMKSLQLIELHVQSQSPWFAREFIEAVPPSATRLYLTDLFIERDVGDLTGFVGEKTNTPLLYWNEINDAYAIGEDLRRNDYIRFSNNQLAFVGYEYDLLVGQSAADVQSKAMAKFLKLNGRLLDKERNRHLAPLAGRHILFKQGGTGRYADTAETRSQAKVEKYRKVLDKCGLHDNEYFGCEDVAEAVFQNEPAATGGHYSYPMVLEVEDEFKFSNHWLSK